MKKYANENINYTNIKDINLTSDSLDIWHVHYFYSVDTY